MSTTTVRMDDDLKAEVNAILDSMGLNFNTFVNMASVQLVSQRRIPFEVRAPEPVLPHAGHVAANGVTYRGVDEQGYPVVERHGVESEPGLRWCCRTAQGVARWRIIMIFRN